MVHGRDAFPAKNCDIRSEEFAGALSWRRINEQFLYNSPRLRLTATISLFNASK
jgi:hypothetical protein